MSFLLDAFGAVGFILLLVAFFLNLSKKIIRNTFIYNGLNFVGSAILLYYAYQIGSMFFVVLEAVWAIISLAFLFRKTHHHIRHRKKKP
jgi:hypothetical protein